MYNMIIAKFSQKVKRDVTYKKIVFNRPNMKESISKDT